MKQYMVEAQLARERQAAVRRAFEIQRLMKAQQVYRPGLGGRILATLGDLMVAGGTRLKARYEAGVELNRQDTKNAKLKAIGY
jgi:hypothetical protein